MDDENLIQHRSGPLGFLKRVIHKFLYGDTESIEYTHQHANAQFPNLDLEFDLHPGPLKDALTDAKTLGKRLCIYIYCADNPLSVQTDRLLENPMVSERIASDFIFYPTSVTSADGYSIAVGAKFREIPMFLVVTPNGDSFDQITINRCLQGEISLQSLLMSLSTTGNNQENTNASVTDPIVQEQNEEYRNAEHEIEQREAREAREVRERETEQAEVERRFRELPELPHGTDNSCVVKFRFDNRPEEVKVFYRDTAVSSLFDFVRHFAFPRQFSLFMSGSPMVQLEDSDELIGNLNQGASFVVVVIYE